MTHDSCSCLATFIRFGVSIHTSGLVCWRDCHTKIDSSKQLRLVQVAIFPPLSSSLRFPKVARQHRLKIHFEKNSCQNLSQKMFTFFQWISTFQSIYQIYAFFGPLFLLPKAPFWSPFHSKSGPHFEKLRSPSHVGAVTLILSVFSYIVFTFLYSHTVVYVHFLPGPKTQGILCQGSLVCCFVKNSCIFSLFPKFLYF